MGSIYAAWMRVGTYWIQQCCNSSSDVWTLTFHMLESLAGHSAGIMHRNLIAMRGYNGEESKKILECVLMPDII